MTALRSSHRRILAFVAVALCIGTFIAWAGGGSTTLLPFTAVLNGGQETPPNDSTALGVGFFTLDTKTNVLQFSVSYTPLATGTLLAHLHGPAAPGVAATPVIDLPATNPIRGVTDPLTKDQVSMLKKGLLYVNIHSTDLPTGEIRGQLLPSKPSFKVPVVSEGN